MSQSEDTGKLTNSWPILLDHFKAMFDEFSNYQHVFVGKINHQEQWNEFSEVIKHGSRFFSLEGKQILHDIFKGIEEYVSSTGEKVIRLRDGKPIYRARKVKTNHDIEAIYTAPSAQLSAPPRELVNNGRLNPLGIPVFYGAFDVKTCLSELRLYVGSLS